MKFKIKGWESYQQYKDDRPMHWIKLHTTFLEDYALNQLSELSQLHLMKLWLVAAKNKGFVEGDAAWLAKLINAKKIDLDELVRTGFLIRTEAYESVPREENIKQRREYKEEDINESREEKIKNIVELKPEQSFLVFDYWRSVMQHPKSQLDDKRKALINRFLKLYPIEDLKQAIHGCSVTPFNMGDNDRGQVYDSLTIILKNGDQIDRFMNNSLKPPLGNIKTIDQTQDKIAAVTARLEAQMQSKMERMNG